MEIILSHVSADFDALASMIAAQKLYPQARPVFTGPADTSVREFLTIYKDVFHIETSKDVDREKVKRIVLVDTQVPGRLGDFKDLVNNPGIELHIFDHHEACEEGVKGDAAYMEPLGATVTILLKEIRKRHIPVNPVEATLFAIGIYEETGSLSFTTTTEEDVSIVAWLLSCGASLRVLQGFIHQSLTEEQRNLLNELILSSRVVVIEGFEIIIATGVTGQYIDELALLSQRLMELQRVDALFALVKMGERIYVAARSKEHSVDVNEVMAAMGGGGHTTAASASLKKQTLKDVEHELLEILQSSIKPAVVARDMMTSPVHTISSRTTIREAHQELLRFGHSGLPVLDDNCLAGIITRKDVDKALHHGYGNAPASAYMSRPVITVTPETTLADVRKKLIDEDIGRLPVMDNARLIGIITRTDLLKNLHREDLAPHGRSFRRTLDYIKKLPIFLQSILETAGSVGDEVGMPVYSVGGFVRDLLLGVRNLDVDLVVEGDGISYARALASRLDARVKVHEKFRTAHIILPDRFRIDVATARSEYYTRPAALPQVYDSSLKQDLYRRDFTINALAIRLNSNEFGTMVDFFGSLRDLRSGVVRVLHNLSFIDDPTRIFRAIKFEQRYHFRMDQHTEALLRAALSMDIFHKVSADRIRDEIIQILEEERPLPALKRMEQLKITRIIHPDLVLDTKVTGVLEDITATVGAYRELIRKERLDVWIIFFTGLVNNLPPDAVSRIGEKYKVSARQLQKLTYEKGEFTRLVKSLSGPRLSRSELVGILEGISLEGILYILSRIRLPRTRERLTEYLSGLYRLKPLVGGKDLEEWGYEPGPTFRTILAEARRAQLDEEMGTKEEVRIALREKFPPPSGSSY